MLPDLSTAGDVAKKKPTRNAIGTVSSTATLVRGIENTLAPAGSALLEGGCVPHWYSTYVSFTSKLRTICDRHNAGLQLANMAPLSESTQATLRVVDLYFCLVIDYTMANEIRAVPVLTRVCIYT